MTDKRMTADEAVSRVEDGMTVGIGGWGSRRKPMALVRALLRSPVKDLTVVSYGGPDVGLLCAAGKIRKVVYGFVSLDSIPLEPHFRAAREAGAVEALELDEGMFLAGLRAAALRLPFMPVRGGIGSDVRRNAPFLRTVADPYGSGDEVMAAPPLELDVALVHANLADARGNAALTGPDQFFDDLFCLAARTAYVSAERLVPTADLRQEAGCLHSLVIHRHLTTGVIEAPRGAHFTECPPEYGRDEAFQQAYARAAADPESWAVFADRFLSHPDEPSYQQAVDEFRAATREHAGGAR
ncbi:CoA transferase subunit A [Streptantibioticus ferralitis]|uniref:Acyl CoA--acetate/3-ketoacid CoA transferase subunit alpha n=1 Tax=Streptantibioticus ferralitis TaxID=236510 RepID=A0ABT5ZA60_9ACTN|nr:CoA-transferase [Streptantibioticus ferralitis]MDF2260623.1 acyl CoA--acetate/3-ketoacid CoA transferase subunit alpha [Streptantibioticus ferralitis]